MTICSKHDVVGQTVHGVPTVGQHGMHIVHYCRVANRLALLVNVVVVGDRALLLLWILRPLIVFRNRGIQIYSILTIYFRLLLQDIIVKIY